MLGSGDIIVLYNGNMVEMWTFWSSLFCKTEENLSKNFYNSKISTINSTRTKLRIRKINSMFYQWHNGDTQCLEILFKRLSHFTQQSKKKNFW